MNREQLEMQRLLNFFAYEHLPPRLQHASAPCHALAHSLARRLPASTEMNAGLRKLLEAKDCFVRALLEDLDNDIRRDGGTASPG